MPLLYQFLVIGLLEKYLRIINARHGIEPRDGKGRYNFPRAQAEQEAKKRRAARKPKETVSEE